MRTSLPPVLCRFTIYKLLIYSYSAAWKHHYYSLNSHPEDRLFAGKPWKYHDYSLNPRRTLNLLMQLS